VEAGEEIEVFKDNRPVAKIIPLSRRRQWLPASEIGRELARLGPDTTGLSEELRATLTGDDGRSTLVIPQRALADTSVFIGLEAARFDSSRFENFEWVSL